MLGTIRELIRIEGCFPALRNLYVENKFVNFNNREFVYIVRSCDAICICDVQVFK